MKKKRKYDDGLINRPYIYKWHVQLRSQNTEHRFNFIEGWFTGKELDSFVNQGYTVRELDRAIVSKEDTNG